MLTIETTLATIKLGNGHRGELFVRDGSIWCRDTETGEVIDGLVATGIETEEEAARMIHDLYSDGAGTWGLEWAN